MMSLYYSFTIKYYLKNAFYLIYVTIFSPYLCRARFHIKKRVKRVVKIFYVKIQLRNLLVAIYLFIFVFLCTLLLRENRQIFDNEFG